MRGLYAHWNSSLRLRRQNWAKGFDQLSLLEELIELGVMWIGGWVMMATRSVTLEVSNEVYEIARLIAEASSRPVEEILRQRLETALTLPQLSPEEEAELAALRQLSDDALWTIAAEQMPRPLQERRKVLLSLNERGVLTEPESAELDALLQRGDRLMVRKAEAAGILTERGYKVTSRDLAAPHE